MKKEKKEIRKQTLATFPLIYINLVEAVSRGQRIQIPYPTRQEASIARFRFYDFKKALRLHPEPHIQELSIQADGIIAVIRKSSIMDPPEFILEYSLRDEMSDVALMAKALQHAGAIPEIQSNALSPDEIQEEIEKLKSQIENENPIENPIENPNPIKTQEDLLIDFFPEGRKKPSDG